MTLRLPPPGTLIADVDVTRITQVVANLLNNAAKYTPQQGRIEISAEHADDRARISIKDSGVGIPAEMLPQVFEMFAQIDRTLERSQGGLGIGLALVKNLVELHGGSVEAHSMGKGHGSQFVVHLPLSVTNARLSPQVPASTLTSHPSKNMRVLVVDDNVDSAESLSQCLRMLGYQTLTAHDGLGGCPLSGVLPARCGAYGHRLAACERIRSRQTDSSTAREREIATGCS